MPALPDLRPETVAAHRKRLPPPEPNCPTPPPDHEIASSCPALCLLCGGKPVAPVYDTAFCHGGKYSRRCWTPLVREMKRFGILPEDLGAEDPIDVYATDQAYWRSFWYHPPGE